MNRKFVSAIISLFALNFSGVCYADILDGDGVLRSDDGSVRKMNLAEARSACPAGTHLPTAREIAFFNQSLGARGILEIRQAPRGTPSGYIRITAVSFDGRKDEFYYSTSGYREPENDAFKWNWFWSSSIEKNLFGRAAIVQHGAGFLFESQQDSNAVRCFRNQ